MVLAGFIGNLVDTYVGATVQVKYRCQDCQTVFISDDERNAWLTESDVVVFPSLYEPFGIVALEYEVV